MESVPIATVRLGTVECPSDHFDKGSVPLDLHKILLEKSAVLTV